MDLEQVNQAIQEQDKLNKIVTDYESDVEIYKQRLAIAKDGLKEATTRRDENMSKLKELLKEVQ